MTSPLIVDIYAGDGDFNVEALVEAGPPWHGVMTKVSQGDYYNGGDWFRRMWPRIKNAGGVRSGVDWFRLGYHYFDVRIDPIKQADYYLKTIESAGGWGEGDLWPCIDVERAGQRGAISASVVITKVKQWVERVRAKTGSDVVLYGGSWLRELGTRDRMGCKYAWVARYTSTLPALTYTSIGFDLRSLFAWQYAGLNGDGSVDGSLKKCPLITPAGKADISVVTLDGGGMKSLDAMRRASR